MDASISTSNGASYIFLDHLIIYFYLYFFLVMRIKGSRTTLNLVLYEFFLLVQFNTVKFPVSDLNNFYGICVTVNLGYGLKPQ